MRAHLNNGGIYLPEEELNWVNKLPKETRRIAESMPQIYGSDTNIQDFENLIRSKINRAIKNFRPHQMRFMKESFIKSLLALCEIINPNSKDLSIQNNCMGPDISTPLISTNATFINAVDIAYDDKFSNSLKKFSSEDIEDLKKIARKASKRTDTIDKLFKSKYENCFYIAGLQNDKSYSVRFNNLLVMIELYALGASNLDTSKPGQISFDWKHPRDREAKRRVIVFNKGDIRDTQVLPYKFDGFIQRTAFNLSLPQNSLDLVNDDGFFLFGPHLGKNYRSGNELIRKSLLSVRNRFTDRFFHKLSPRFPSKPDSDTLPNYGEYLSLAFKRELSSEPSSKSAPGLVRFD